MTTKAQRCTLCGSPSLPGLAPGSGKCQWHWTAGTWGWAWALQILGPAPQEQPPKG